MWLDCGLLVRATKFGPCLSSTGTSCTTTISG